MQIQQLPAFIFSFVYTTVLATITRCVGAQSLLLLEVKYFQRKSNFGFCIDHCTEYTKKYDRLRFILQSESTKSVDVDMKL
ncbi:hypothetical protein SOMG_02799 [Schizosaccharomyces osmophilus]|uniref:Uncharacterized protein n=1 Tax=Schizosaccharomyces osmophilus TaxID=2545709 RepID=A0AAE9WBJ2_9SCHI|nr:uncharacterized protein SOMG_02799 [Schizosaccharomyces osmophilus]WBW73214.1 hypothetical protein SOMG_02799 [Schizosaccharomyces osmophilus]